MFGKQKYLYGFYFVTSHFDLTMLWIFKVWVIKLESDMWIVIRSLFLKKKDEKQFVLMKKKVQKDWNFWLERTNQTLPK